MSARRPLDLERLRHVSGELLRSQDLRDAVAADAELQWWHQRAVHDSFGIAVGLSVEFDVDGESVFVAPGLAFDCFGRDLIVTSERNVPVPSDVGDGMTLLLRYQDDPRGLQGDSALVWRRTARIDARAGVPLAVVDSDRALSLTPAVPRPRPLARPRVAAGATQPDGTPWEPIGGVRAGGIEVHVDTRPAGFTQRPCYFAWLQWPRLNAPPRPSLIRALSLQYVERPAIGGFTFRIWMYLQPDVGIRPGEEFVSLARREQLYVSWLGLQCENGADRERSEMRRA